MKKLLIVVASLFILEFSYSQVESEFDRDLELLFEKTGSIELSNQVMSQMTEAMKVYYPDIPLEFWEEVENSIDANELLDLIIPIYKKYYTHEDVKALLEFYNTPIGQKSIKTMPSIMQESMSVGMSWGEKMGIEIMERIEQEGY